MNLPSAGIDIAYITNGFVFFFFARCISMPVTDILHKGNAFAFSCISHYTHRAVFYRNCLCDSFIDDLQVMAVDLKGLLERGDTSLDVQIMDGDSIYIPRTGVFYVTGQIIKPGAYKYEEGLTVIKAVTIAGGFTGIASKGKVKIMRKIDEKEEVIENVKMDTTVLVDDVIVVPESFF